MLPMTASKPERFPLAFLLFAILLGVACGALHVLVETMTEPDPLLSALAVTAATMMLGILRPARPWRWVLCVGVPVPLAILTASYVIPTAMGAMRRRPDRKSTRLNSSHLGISYAVF